MPKYKNLKVKLINPGQASGILFKKGLIKVADHFEKHATELDLFYSVLEKVQAKFELNHSEISSVFVLMTKDPSWLDLMTEGMRQGRTAKVSIEQGISKLKLKYSKIDNLFFLEKLKEFEMISYKLLDLLNSHKTVYPDKPFIFMIEKPSPIDLLDAPESLLKGILAKDVTPTSHTTVLARQMNIPLLIIEDGWDDLSPQKWIKIEDDILSFSDQEDPVLNSQTDDSLEKPETKDGTLISFLLNASFEKDIEYLNMPFVSGVGLFRTEFAFLNQNDFPTMETQRLFYSKIFQKAGDAPVAFRIMDIGGDKIPSYFPSTLEDNPLLGWRSIRIALDRPLLLKHQMRALIRSAAEKTLYILFPLLTEAAEFYPLCDLLESELEKEKELGRPLPRSIKKGVMIEVPSFAWHFHTIIKDVDFVSIGTNDLFQFFFGVDRMNPHLAKRYDVLSPIFLSFLKHLNDVVRENRKTVSVCGEMASTPIEALALLGLGFKTLSMPHQNFKPILNMIKSLNLKSFRAYLIPLLSSKEHSLREYIKAYAQDHKIELNL